MGLIHADCSVHTFDADRWVIRTPRGRHLLINCPSHDLYELLTSAESWREATDRFNAEYATDLEETFFRDFVKGQFAGYDILLGETEADQASPQKKYLTLKVPIVPGRVAGWLADGLRFLFSTRTFWYVFPLLLILTGALLYSQYLYPFWNEPIKNGWLTLGFISLGYLVHELGHIAACRSAGAAHGEIGIGLYVMFPVCYADVSGIWTVGREQRAIVNLGGIYLETVYCFVLVIAYFLTGNFSLLGAATVLAANLLFELNPFFRNDGYWILVDLTNTPNLVQRSVSRLTELFKPVTYEKQDHWWLAVYALLNLTFIVASVGLLVYHTYPQLITFPGRVVDLLRHWFALDFATVRPTYAWFIYTVVYYVLIKLAITGLSAAGAYLLPATVTSSQKTSSRITI